jgi:hypothetical protein
VAGVVADDRCPKCGGPRTTYPDGSRRCKPCRSKERAAQQRRARQRADVSLDALIAAQHPTAADIAAARDRWLSGDAGTAVRSAGISGSRLARTVGCSEPVARKWMNGGGAPQRRYEATAAAVLLAVGAVPQLAVDGPDLSRGAIPYNELSDVARDCWGDFEAFRARYLGSVSTPWQVMAAQRVVELLDGPEKVYCVVNCPQGSGKTRLFTHDLACWLTVRDRTRRGLIGSLGRALSESLCGNLRDTLEREVPVVARDVDRTRGLALDAEATVTGDYGSFRGAQLWRRDKFYVAQADGQPAMHKDPTWAAFSREAKFLGWRVDVAIWDDLVNTDMLRNPEAVEDLYRWWHIEAESRVDTGGLLLVVGQRLGANDIYRHLLDARVPVTQLDGGDATEPERAQYVHICFKAHYDELCDGGTHTRNMPPTTFDPATGEPDGGSCMLDAARITPRDIDEKRAAGIYEVVYQQEDTDPTNVLVRKVWIEGGTEDRVDYIGCWDHDRAIGQLPAIPPGSDVIRYLSVDPSPTRYWGILDVLYVRPPDTERTAGNRYIIDLARRKMGANDFLDRGADGTYIGLAEDWVTRAKQQGHPVQYLIFERNAAQRWFTQYAFVHDWRRTRSVQVVEHETTRNKLDETYGIWATLPNTFRYGRIRLPGDRATSSRAYTQPLVQEVTTYPGGATDDLVMALWFPEVHLPHLIGALHPVPPIYNDRPSWLSGGHKTPSRAQQLIAEQATRLRQPPAA